MVEKNILLTTKDADGRTVVMRPYTSMYQVEGLQEYVSRKFDQFLAKIKNIFVTQESGKGLSSNDFSDEYKSKIDSLDTTMVKTLTINGQEVSPINGTISITAESVVVKLEDNDIETIFNDN